jgi:hypothetical protein
MELGGDEGPSLAAHALISSSGAWAKDCTTLALGPCPAERHRRWVTALAPLQALGTLRQRPRGLLTGQDTTVQSPSKASL